MQAGYDLNTLVVTTWCSFCTQEDDDLEEMQDDSIQGFFEHTGAHRP